MEWSWLDLLLFFNGINPSMGFIGPINHVGPGPGFPEIIRNGLKSTDRRPGLWPSVQVSVEANKPPICQALSDAHHPNAVRYGGSEDDSTAQEARQSVSFASAI